MKRKVIALLTMISLILSGLTVFATNGDIKQTLYTTDIITQFDNKQIKGYSLDGRMMIALEDLADYGYTVNYDNDIRTVFVTKTGSPSENFNPSFPRQEEGKFYGYTYETNIKAYLNGVLVPAENIDGKTLVIAEKIADIFADGNPNMKYGTSKYFLDHHYDDSTRMLSLYNTTGSLPSADEQLDNLKNGKQPYGTPIATGVVLGVHEYFQTYDNGYFVHASASVAPANAEYLYLIRSSKEYIDLKPILYQYGFLSSMGVLASGTWSINSEKNLIYFNGVLPNKTESQTYSINLSSLQVNLIK